MNLYRITLWHAGTRTREKYLINALDHLAAVRAVCDHTGAPATAVVSWEDGTATDVAIWRKELGVN